jgi:tetratricopeptide (TPR) repeat protein
MAAQYAGAQTNLPAMHASTLFVDAKSAYQSQPEQLEAAWKFARACFDWAEFATNNTQRAALAQQGIAAARQALTRASNSAAAHYYLAMNLGQSARTKSLGALRLVDEMEACFKRARELDEMFDFAGPDRNLGTLYLEAPSLASVGSRTKARLHYKQAAELAPEYPENRLNLVESAIRWKETEAARRELEILEQTLPEALIRFSGEAWAWAWADWNPRLEQARNALRRPGNAPGKAGARAIN